ncbi:MAG: DUF1127 domain-containing protein [Paracoccaceae bacterium]|nr:MAG: DUF1127 domain-containing protein [Paracoccaceae bacterium]
MTVLTTNTTAARPGLLSRAVSGFWNFLVLLAESGPMMEQVRRLNATTDEDLAARGLTREGEVRRIFGARMGL